MKRYIVDKAASKLLNLQTLDAIKTLASNIVITDEALHYNNLPYISVPLTDNEVVLLKQNGFNPTEEVVKKATMLGGDYEKVRGSYFKTKYKGLDGTSVKVGLLDTGCTQWAVPVEYAYNFIDSNTDISDNYGHGTCTTSIIKHINIGLAPKAEVHHLKVIADQGYGNESAMLAAFDYVIAHKLDFINMSWTFDTMAIRTAIANVQAGGTVCIAASGNNFEQTYTLIPAALPGVIAVNACLEDGTARYQNVLAPDGMHGISVACSGRWCEVIFNNGVYGVSSGTSFASPYFTGLVALYKQELGIADNNAVVQYALKRATKTTNSQYFGAGLASF